MTNLAKIMKEQGRKRAWLAAAVGVTGATITNWANGRTIPSYLHAVAVARILEEPVASIWPENGSGTTNNKEVGT